MTTDIITIGCGLPIGASGRRNRLAECPLGINGNICMKKGAFLSHFFSFFSKSVISYTQFESSTNITVLHLYQVGYWYYILCLDLL